MCECNNYGAFVLPRLEDGQVVVAHSNNAWDMRDDAFADAALYRIGVRALSVPGVPAPEPPAPVEEDVTAEAGRDADRARRAGPASTTAARPTGHHARRLTPRDVVVGRHDALERSRAEGPADRRPRPGRDGRAGRDDRVRDDGCAAPRRTVAATPSSGCERREPPAPTVRCHRVSASARADADPRAHLPTRMRAAAATTAAPKRRPGYRLSRSTGPLMLIAASDARRRRRRRGR